jgi:serine phosphatase RsbU (regulator of sigma subunit)/catechol 2,3-dioxygenase-like lactoylglutathione lyase family enzyme
LDSPFLGIHAVTIFVRDQERSLRFYVDQLGFRVAFDASLPTGTRWLAVAPPDGNTVLALVAPETESRQFKLIGRATGIVFVSENPIAKWEEWRKCGVHFLTTPRLRRVKFGAAAPGEGDADPVWGGVFVRFRDPDGNSFELVGFDAVSRAIEAERRRVAEKEEAERRAAKELEIAKEVQARLFPQKLPQVATLEYAGACIQAREVGGDYHDFLDLGRGRFGLVIADISGKGMPAALLMANLQANIRSQCAIALDDPGRWLRSVNQLFYENTADSSYATLFYAEYEDATGRLRYGNCGHLPALLLRSSGEVERLESTCTVLGLFGEWQCPISERQISPGDTLALYTDGVTEAFDQRGQEFGEQRLLAALQERRGLAPCDVVGSVVQEVQRFSDGEQHDDITLIVARCPAAD